MMRRKRKRKRERWVLSWTGSDTRLCRANLIVQYYSDFVEGYELNQTE